MWRQLRDYRDSYIAAAIKLEQDFQLDRLEYPVERINEVETCPAIERALLRHVERHLAVAFDDELLALTESRRSRFWAVAMPAIQARWALIASAAEVLREADRVAQALKHPPATVPALIERYAEGEAPWCLLDMHHRHMESRWHNFDPVEEQDGLDKLVVKARQRYSEVGSAMAKHFVIRLAQAGYPLEDVQRQRDIFDARVKPVLGERKIAYVWVDALRFEMARELGGALRDTFHIELQPAMATAPTITEIGMASLLPNAGNGRVVSVGSGKLGLEIAGRVIKDRKDRVNFLREQVNVEFFEAKLEDLLPKPSKGVGGTAESSYLRTALSSLGVDSEYDIAAPYTFAVFKAKGGARAYFHGGLSPQEIIIPMMTMSPSRHAVWGPPAGIDWRMSPGTPKLTTRFFSVQIAGEERSSSLFGFEPPKVQLELRARGKCVSRPVSASYGFEDATGEVQLRTRDDDPNRIEPNTIALMLVEEISQKTVSAVLLDASSGAELATLDNIEVDISI